VTWHDPLKTGPYRYLKINTLIGEILARLILAYISKSEKS